MNEVHPINRPPAIDLREVHPSEPVVRINTDCAGERQTEFWADVIELDIDQELLAYWFWNYDAGAESADLLRPPLDEHRVTQTGDTRRSIPSFHLPAHPGSDLNAEGVHTLEVFVVEEDALVRGRGEEPPFYRNLRDCGAEGYPDDCVSTHPAVMRWTIHNVAEGSCP